jgi:cyclophilin family peptidyl-prolyl cis-trans isomerase
MCLAHAKYRLFCAPADGKHTVYGELVEGFDTLESIEGVPAPKGTRPPVKISSARIITKLASRDSELTR